MEVEQLSLEAHLWVTMLGKNESRVAIGAGSNPSQFHEKYLLKTSKTRANSPSSMPDLLNSLFKIIPNRFFSFYWKLLTANMLQKRFFGAHSSSCLSSTPFPASIKYVESNGFIPLVCYQLLCIHSLALIVFLLQFSQLPLLLLDPPFQGCQRVNPHTLAPTRGGGGQVGVMA